MNDYLMHHGVKGQRWGIRRFQNEDGSLTPEGMQRYGVDAYGNMSRKGQAEYYKDMYKDAKARGLKGQDLHNDVRSRYNSDEEYINAVNNYKKWRAGRTTAIALGSAGAAALTGGAIAGVTLGVKSAKHNKSVRQVQSALQNLEITNSSLENQRRQYQKAFQDIKDGRRENTRGKDFYEILPGQIDWRHSDTVVGGVKNDLMSNTVLRLRDNVRSQKENAKQIEDLKSQLSLLQNKKNRFRTVKNMKHSYIVPSEDVLIHHGIRGQKWGVRRFQNEDGSLTPEGVQRYGMDQYGNMSKKGAANYYRDIYKDAKASGYRGRGVHDAVRSKFDSEEEYQAFVKNYRDYKGKKALIGVGAGLAGTALAGAATYGIIRGAKAARNNALADKYGDAFKDMRADELLKSASDSATAAKSFSGPLKKQLQRDSIIAETLAKRKLKENQTGFKAKARSTADTSEIIGIAGEHFTKAANMPTGTRFEKIAQKHEKKIGRIAEKEAYRRIGQEAKVSARVGAMQNARMMAGADATANAINAFSNSLVGKTASGFGTLAGGIAIGATAAAGKRAVSKIFDDSTANSVFAPTKDYKDKSSVVTQPVRMDKAWRSASKDDEDDEEKRRKKDED